MIQKVTVDDVKNAGVIVDWDKLTASLKIVTDSYGYNNVPASEVKKSESYLTIIQIVHGLIENNGSKEQLALLNQWIAERFCSNASNYLSIPFFEESFNIYKEYPAHTGKLLNCGQHLVIAYDMYKSYDNAIETLKYCLEVIEEKEGVKGDNYCNFIIYTILGKLGNEEYREHLRWFINDYSLKDSSIGNAFYDELCWQISQLYNAKLSDEEHRFWFESYLKYKILDIEYRGQISEEKRERGFYDLGVMYSCEYGRTNKTEYCKAAKELLSSIKGSYYTVAQQELAKI